VLSFNISSSWSRKSAIQVSDERFKELYNKTIERLVASFETHVAESPYRHFGKWALTSTGPEHDDFAQIFGIKQLTRMSALLLERTATRKETWRAVLTPTAVINTWLTHEVISDNLGIGLGFPSSFDDEQMHVRRELIYRFDAEIQRILELPGTRSISAEEAAIPFLQYDGKESIFSHMLAPEKYRCLARTFAVHSAESAESVENCVSAALAANILSCFDTLASMTHGKLKELTRRWITSRYMAVDKLMKTEGMTTDELIDYGACTILVAPTLGYHIDSLANANGDSKRIDTQAILPLEQSLRSAAVLVRLLNDLGTFLLTCSSEERDIAFEQASAEFGVTRYQPLADVLVRFQSPAFTRLAKDAIFREINLALHGLGHRPASVAVTDEFHRRIRVYAEIYTQEKSRMNVALERLQEQLRDDQYGTIIASFVGFHENLYNNHYHTNGGEYAI
jgi:hypothetical protein